MKHLVLVNTASITLLLSTAMSFAGNLTHGIEDAIVQQPVQRSDWYVSGFAGTSNLDNVNTFTRRVIGGGRPVVVIRPVSVSFDSGFTAGVTVGKHIFWNFRLEAELSYSKYDANNMEDGTRGSGPATGDLTANYLLANIWYDIPLKSKISPYVGGGIGVAKVDADVQFGGGLGSGYQNSGTNFSYQFGIGFTYPLSPKLSLDVGYRYKVVPNVDFDDGFFPTLIYHDGELRSSNLQIGLMYDF
jgi:opacity protein-like surface antigen